MTVTAPDGVAVSVAGPAARELYGGSDVARSGYEVLTYCTVTYTVVRGTVPVERGKLVNFQSGINDHGPWILGNPHFTNALVDAWIVIAAAKPMSIPRTT